MGEMAKAGRPARGDRIDVMEAKLTGGQFTS
jgi:hypothetical protein